MVSPKVHPWPALVLASLVASCKTGGSPNSERPPREALTPSFESAVVSVDANQWWAHKPVDIDGDGFVDLALQDNNARGGWLGWLENPGDQGAWRQHLVASEGPNGQLFAAGDLEAGDVDSDGDVDLLGITSSGEWVAAGNASTLYWFANPEWTAHEIGQVPAFVKDVSMDDLNADGTLDLVTITYERNTLTVFRQDAPNAWVAAVEIQIPNLHEGMDVGDIDGDGDSDIATNGYWLENPGGLMAATWRLHVVAERWHNQDGDWSKNATKVATADVDGDGRVEIFISHSERAGYPLAWYDSVDPRAGVWNEHIIHPQWPAAQTIQLADFDKDGDVDVLSGVNAERAADLGIAPAPVVLFLNQGEAQSWEALQISEEGIYNGEATDIEGDGDIDILRIGSHSGKKLHVLLNQLR